MYLLKHADYFKNVDTNHNIDNNNTIYLYYEESNLFIAKF